MRNLENSPLESIPARQRAVTRSLRIYLVAVLVLTGLACSITAVRAYVLHDSYPKRSLLPPPEFRFLDFTEDAVRVAHYGQPDMLSRNDLPIPFSYPLPGVYVFLFFMRAFPDGLKGYLGFTIACFVLFFVLLSLKAYREHGGKLVQAAIWLTLCTSFPLVVLLDRGNIEGVIWALVVCGLFAYTRDRMITASVFLSMAASIKIVPGILFLLFLAKRRYSAFVLAILLTATFSILALAGVGPTIHQAFEQSARAGNFLKEYFLISPKGIPGNDTSLFGVVKQVIYIYKFQAHTLSSFASTMRTVLPIYSATIVALIFVLYIFRLRHLPIMNQLIAYIVMYLLFPQISNEYKLIHMYIVWGALLLFLITDVRGGRSQLSLGPSTALLLSCAVLFTPTSYIFLGNTFLIGDQIKAGFLGVILVLALLYPMPSSLFGDLNAREVAPGL